MGQKLGALDVDVMLEGVLVNFEEMNVTIDDKTAPTMTRGVPDGFVHGDVSGSGEATVDTENLNLILASATAAGSFQEMPAFDVLFHAATVDTKLSVEAFGCKFRISDLINASNSTTEQLKHKLPFDITDPDFIRINGIPYAKSRGLAFGG